MQNSNSDLLYSLDDKPPIRQTIVVAFQHILASFVGIVTPTLIIGSALGLDNEMPHLISMALLASGIGTFIQSRRFGPVGSGLLTVQGTSFAFIGALLIAGASVKSQGGSNADIMAMMLGISMAGALVEVILSVFIHRLKTIITPLTTGIVITAIGLSLIKVGMTDLAGGFGADNFGAPSELSLGLVVVLVIVFLNAAPFPLARLSAIFVGIAVGAIMAGMQGQLSIASATTLPAFSLPHPFKYGIAFDWGLFLPVAFIYFFSAIETAGDLTANSLFCRLPVSGDSYLQRIKRGILADGINSIIANSLNSFPNTTFGQNNGVIQLTGVASRRVGIAIGCLLMLLGLFPVIGGVLQALPKPIIGGATLIMFAMVAVGGLKLLTQNPLTRKDSLIVASALGAGVGVMMVPSALQGLPQWSQYALSSPVTTSGLVAVLLTLTLPGKRHKRTTLKTEKEYS